MICFCKYRNKALCRVGYDSVYFCRNLILWFLSKVMETLLECTTSQIEDQCRGNFRTSFSVLMSLTTSSECSATAVIHTATRHIREDMAYKHTASYDRQYAEMYIWGLQTGFRLVIWIIGLLWLRNVTIFHNSLLTN